MRLPTLIVMLTGVLLAPLAMWAQSNSANYAEIVRVMESFIEATGGRQQIAEVDTIVGLGEFRRRGQSWPMQWVRRSPDLSRIWVEQSEGVFLRVYDGQRFAEKLPFHEHFSAMPTDEVAFFAPYLALIHPILIAYDRSAGIAYLGIRTLDGIDVEVLEYENPHLGRTQVFFNPATHLPIQSNVFDEDGEVLQIFRLSDYRTVGNLLLPHLFEIEREGWVREALLVDSYEINAGILTSVFEPDE